MKNLRIRKIQAALKNPILIKKKENLFYLTGRSFDYRAEEYLLVTKREVVGFGSGLENIDWVKKSDRLKNIGKYIKGKKLDLEWGFTFGEEAYLRAKALGLRTKPARSPVDEMRQIKDAGELSKIKKSMQIVEKVFGMAKNQLKKKSWTERGLAEFITNTGYKFGAEDVAFPAIVASGANAAIPHHVPSSKRLKPGESIIIDFGFKYKNYCSDFTRTVFLKRAPSRLERAYNQVERAYIGSMEVIDSRLSLIGGAARIGPRNAQRGRTTIREARPYTHYDLQAGDVYQHSVNVLAEAKLDKFFIHSLGHGTGLEIHELPNLSPGSKDILRDNMVFSIEPGVYIRGVGGIRIEDLVYLKNDRVFKFINVSTGLKDNIIH